MGKGPDLTKLAPFAGGFAILLCLQCVGLAATAQSTAPSLRGTLQSTGTPNPHPVRFDSATLVKAGSQKLLFDIGRAATICLDQLGIPMREVSPVFITHFHSDHLVGLADLWLIGWLPPNHRRRQALLRIWSPSGLGRTTEGPEQAYSTDINIQVRDEGLSRSAASFDVTEFSGNWQAGQSDLLDRIRECQGRKCAVPSALH